MRRFTLAASLLLLLALTATAQSPLANEWVGIYEYDAFLGRTAGGTGIIVSYAITVSSDNSATIKANGWQIDDEVICDARVRGNRIDLYFNSYPDGGDSNQYGVRLYKKGNFLFSLQRINNKRFRVRWGKYNTDLTRGVIFIKVMR